MKKSENKRLPEETDSKTIEVRAYELYEQRGGEPGHELEDWLEAEREIGKITMAKEPESIDKRLRASGR